MRENGFGLRIIKPHYKIKTNGSGELNIQKAQSLQQLWVIFHSVERKHSELIFIWLRRSGGGGGGTIRSSSTPASHCARMTH